MTTNGICGYLDWSPEELAEADRELEERRKKEAESEQYASECQATYDALEAMFIGHVREEAKAVNATTRIRPADQKIFSDFKEYCSTWDPPLPPLPAHPASVAAFVCKDLAQGTTHFMKYLNAISRVHLAVGLPDPTTDVLIQSLVRKLKNPQE